MAKKPKRPRDPNQLGKSIIDIATGNAPPDPPVKAKARKGGLKGGPARAAVPNEAPVNVEGFATKNEALIWIRHEADAWLKQKRQSKFLSG